MEVKYKGGSMMKKVLIISTSLRKNGNSETLADEFATGALEVGNVVEKISLHGKTIQFCNACLVCQKTYKCVIKDDMEQILKSMEQAEVIVFATPIYFYEMTGQMKTLLDRTNPLYPTKYEFREIYLISTSADSNIAAIDGVMKGIQGWISCFPKTRLAGTLLGAGVDQLGEIKTHPEKLREAYEMGKSV